MRIFYAASRLILDNFWTEHEQILFVCCHWCYSKRKKFSFFVWVIDRLSSSTQYLTYKELLMFRLLNGALGNDFVLLSDSKIDESWQNSLNLYGFRRFWRDHQNKTSFFLFQKNFNFYFWIFETGISITSFSRRPLVSRWRNQRHLIVSFLVYIYTFTYKSSYYFRMNSSLMRNKNEIST